MRQLTCEICGSTDLVKQDGVFVCQSCGTRYSVEEARRIMVEGTVDVTGSTVRVDNSGRIETLYTLARRAKSDGNFKDASENYNLILHEDPNSWEANFYYPYCQALQCKVGEAVSRLRSVRNSIGSTLRLIKDIPDPNQRCAAVKEIKLSIDYMELYCKNMYMQHMRSSNAKTFGDMWSAAMYSLAEFRERLIDYFENDADVMTAVGLELLKECLPNPQINDKYSAIIRKYEPDYRLPEKKSGCYIATAVYGSYDCPQVWTLRRYRDYTLAET